jgi:hypothetical protein
VSGGLGSGILGSLSSYRQQLLSEIAGLQQQANALSQAIAAMGGGAAAAVRMPAMPAMPGRRPGRPPGSGSSARLGGGRQRAQKGSLKECIMRVLSESNGPVPVKEIIPGVKRVGYKTNSKSLGNQISMALRGMKQVKRVGHGMYALVG